LVRNGYQSAAVEFRGQKDSSILNLPIFQQFLSHLPADGPVIELGCGSGYPIAHHLATVSYTSNRRGNDHILSVATNTKCCGNT
jgi:hypothetical protein